MRPRMIVVAGPPGCGKSSLFSPYRLGVDAFVADDQAARLNWGSYQGISPAIRLRVNRELERFITGHIQAGRSFAFETTLLTEATLSQAREARAQGFLTVMRYVAVGNPRSACDRQGEGRRPLGAQFCHSCDLCCKPGEPPRHPSRVRYRARLRQLDQR